MSAPTEWPPQYPDDFTPSPDQEYWSPELETMPPAERDRHVLEKLRHQVRYVHRNSGFYQEFYKDAMVASSNNKSMVLQTTAGYTMGIRT